MSQAGAGRQGLSDTGDWQAGVICLLRGQVLDAARPLFRKPAASSFSATVMQLVGKLPSVARKPRQILRSTKDLSPSFVETRDGEAGTN